jgi:hypothetical protein
MLAEMFFLRLEALRRASEEETRARAVCRTSGIEVADRYSTAREQRLSGERSTSSNLRLRSCSVNGLASKWTPGSKRP